MCDNLDNELLQKRPLFFGLKLMHTHSNTYTSMVSSLKMYQGIVGLLTSVLVKLQRRFIDLVLGPHSLTIYFCRRKKLKVWAFKEDH